MVTIGLSALPHGRLPPAVRPGAFHRGRGAFLRRVFFPFSEGAPTTRFHAIANMQGDEAGFWRFTFSLATSEPPGVPLELV